MIVCDTGPLVAAAVRHDPDHHACVELLTGLRLAGRRLLVPATVVAEVGYLLDRFGSSKLEAQFIESLAAGDFEPVDLTAADYSRIAELIIQYSDLRLGTTDASVIALSERLGLREVATLDRRHFTAVRPRHVDALSLLPEQL